MKPKGKLYEGQVTALTRCFDPVQQIEFRIRGNDVTLVADNRHLFDLNIGDYVYAACRAENGGMAVVLDMIRCGPGGSISESEKADLLGRVGATLELPGVDSPAEDGAGTEGGPATFGQRVFRSCRERAEVEYLKAVRRIVIEPVIMVDARGEEERRLRLGAAEEQAGDLPKVYVEITSGSRSQIAREVAALCRQAAEEIARGPIPELPFTVVVITEGRVEVFNNPEPG